jgi:predicted MFS family arabinose efflux permease
MGGVTPVVWTLLVAGTEYSSPLMSWRAAFGWFGFVGLAWCAIFAWTFHDRPACHVKPGTVEQSRTHPAEGEIARDHRPMPWMAFVRSRNLWLLCVMYFCMAYGWYFNITYLPACLRDVYGVSDQSIVGALYKGGPLWIGAVACLWGGWLTDRLVRLTGDHRAARRRLGCLGFSAGSILFLASVTAPNEHWFFIAISGAAFFGDMTLAASWATCQDIGRRYAATTAAWMNTVGTVGAATAGWAIGTLLQRSLSLRATFIGTTVEALSKDDQWSALSSGYRTCILSFAGAYAVSAICWCFIDPTRPIDTDS